MIASDKIPNPDSYRDVNQFALGIEAISFFEMKWKKRFSGKPDPPPVGGGNAHQKGGQAQNIILMDIVFNLVF